MALGHARLVNRMEGERPTIIKEVMEAFSQRLWRQVEGVGVDVDRVGGGKYRAAA